MRRPTHHWRTLATSNLAGKELTLASPTTIDELELIITRKLEDIMMVNPGYVDRDTPVGVDGVDSFARVALVAEVETELGLTGQLPEFNDNPTIKEIARRIYEAICER